MNNENAPRALLTRDEQKVKEAVVEETKPAAVTAQDQDAMIAKIAEALAEDPC